MVQKFLKDYNERYKEAPSVLSALGFDGALVMADAIKRAGSTDKEKIKEEINKTVNFKGITGTITLDENRNPIKSAIILEAKDGKFIYKTVVSPTKIDNVKKEVIENKEPEKTKKTANKGNNLVIILIISILGVIIGYSIVKNKK